MYAAIVSLGEFVIGIYGVTPVVTLPYSPEVEGRLATYWGFGFGFESVGFGVEYGMANPGVKRVIDMAKRAGSGVLESSLSWGVGTGM
jgi:hypothetical protein